jgi:hypothetical protein
MRRARELLATRSRELVEHAGEAVERVELRTGAWVEHAGKLARESRPAGRASRARSCGPGAVERARCMAPGAVEAAREAAGNRATRATGSSSRPLACQLYGTGGRPIVPAVWHNAREAAHRVEARVPAKLWSYSTGADSVPAVWHREPGS